MDPTIRFVEIQVNVDYSLLGMNGILLGWAVD